MWDLYWKKRKNGEYIRKLYFGEIGRWIYVIWAFGGLVFPIIFLDQPWFFFFMMFWFLTWGIFICGLLEGKQAEKGDRHKPPDYKDHIDPKRNGNISTKHHENM